MLKLLKKKVSLLLSFSTINTTVITIIITIVEDLMRFDNTEPRETISTTSTIPITTRTSYDKHLMIHKKVTDLLKTRNAIPDTSSEPQGSQSNGCRSISRSKCPMYNYVKFWRDPTYKDGCYQSILRHPLGKNAKKEEKKFLVFEPDRGGWNNIRMAAETAIVFALVTGRTLVLPPVMKWYLLDKSKNDHENHSTFSKFFDLDKIADLVDMISMEDFLKDIAVPGLLKNAKANKLQNEADVESLLKHHGYNGKLWKYLEEGSYCREWEPGKYFIGFNFEYDAKNTTNPIKFGSFEDYQLEHPKFENCKTIQDERLQKFCAHGRKVLNYGDMHHERAIFFPGDYRNEYRILTHFYTYLYWNDHHMEHVYKRIVRDRLHYHDDIFCSAGRLVRLLHEEASKLTGKPIPDKISADRLTGGGNTKKGATFHAYHIRRGDFQYEDTRLSAEEIYKQTRHLLDPNVTTLLYIATDEKNKSFFKPFTKDFTVRFLDDYQKQAMLGHEHVNQNYIGMIEQVVAANAHTFIGTPFSTFTGYITRMRGYYRDDRYANTFYTMKSQQHILHKNQANIVGPFWAREFPVAHQQIDDDNTK